MLTKGHQELMIEIFANYMKNGLNSREARRIYISYVGFYRATKYLIDSGLLIKKRDINNKALYKLSLKGEILARILCGMADMPADLQDLGSRIKV